MTDKEIKDELKKANEEYVVKETEVDIIDNFEVNKMKQYRKTYAKIFITSQSPKLLSHFKCNIKAKI